MSETIELTAAVSRPAENGDTLRPTPAIGDEVIAQAGTVGRVVRLLRTESAVQRYMVVATGRFWRRYPVIACALITEIADGAIQVSGDRRALQRESEALPLIV
jgi:hypothetical protein